MKKINEDGITLVELLGTLVLVSIVTAVIWNAAFISMRYTATETKKVHLQQEANYVIAQIQLYHRQCDSYVLSVEISGITLEKCKSIRPLSDLIIKNKFRYESSPVFHEELIKSKTIGSSTEMELTVSDIEKNKLKVKIPTTITRYKSSE